MYEAIEHHKQYMKNKSINNTINNVMNVLSISFAIYVVSAIAIVITQM